MRALASGSSSLRDRARVGLTAWVGAAVAVGAAGCGLILDTSPPDVSPDAGGVLDGGATDADPSQDAQAPLDAGLPDDGLFVIDGDVTSDPDAGTSDAGPPDAGLCLDADGDGVTTCAGDCDDSDPLSAPGNPELCGDLVDNDCDGAVDETCSVGGLGTFVSAQTGHNTNPGTRALPVATIAQGMRNAVTLGLPQTVVVAEGTYREKVTMVEEIDLLGGYQCDGSSCTWARDRAAFVATIENIDLQGVLAPDGVTQETVIDGFRILGSSGTGVAPGSAGITLLGGSPTVRANVIVGGNVTGSAFAGARSIGVHLRGTTDPIGALLVDNDIRGGTATNLSVAVLFDSYPLTTTALATVQRNVLRGGAAPRAVGLTAWNSVPGTLVQDNDIFAGDSRSGSSHGIEVGGTLTIDANRINAGPTATATCTTPTAWCTGIQSESSTTIITNNVVFGPLGPRSTAVFLTEAERPAGTVTLNGNLLDGGGSGPSGAGLSTESAALVVSIGTCTTCGFRGFVGRVRNNILLGGVGQFRFGVLEEPAVGRVMQPEALAHNVFFFGATTMPTDILYRQMSALGVATDHVDVATINALTAPPAAMNRAGDPLVDASWHLLPGSQCIDRGTLVDAPALDFDGDARPRGLGVDIGPDET